MFKFSYLFKESTELSLHACKLLFNPRLQSKDVVCPPIGAIYGNTGCLFCKGT